jgi:hypothetical protein
VKPGTWERGLSWWQRLFGQLGWRYWVARCNYVLHEAKQAGLINNDTRHHLDHRLKYDPNLRY